MTSNVPPKRRGRVWPVITIGLVLLVIAGVLLFRNKPTPTNAGALSTPSTSTSAAKPQKKPATTSVTTSPASEPSPSPAATAARRSTAPPTVATRSASSSTSSNTSERLSSAAPPVGHPAVLHLPTLNVTAHIDSVDSEHGVLQVPEDISRVGWWKHSVNPGSAVGSTVIDGHIDSAAAGEGALFHLADLGPGDPVTVTTSTGATVHYQVQARRVYVKEQGLPADLFNQQGPGRLVIISCGGPFDRSIGSYQDNVAIFATAVT